MVLARGGEGGESRRQQQLNPAMYLLATRRCRYSDIWWRTSIKRCARDLSAQISVISFTGDRDTRPLRSDHVTTARRPCTSHRQILTGVDRPLNLRDPPPPSSDLAADRQDPGAPGQHTRWTVPADAIMKNHCKPLWLNGELAGFRRRRRWRRRLANEAGERISRSTGRGHETQIARQDQIMLSAAW